METTCVHYSRDYVGSPCIVAIDRDRCAIADGSGHLVAVDVRTRDVGPRLFLGLPGAAGASNLRSARRNPARPSVVAVATRAGYAAIGDLDGGAVAKIHPAQGGTVQSVAFSPDGRRLAIGTGAYTTTGDPPPAHVEMWSLPDRDEGPPRVLVVAALPGVCVDAIAWHPEGDRIACATGLRSQKSGFVAQLEPEHLRPRSFFEAGWAGTGRLEYVDRDTDAGCLAVALRGGFRLVDAENGKEALRVDRPEVPELPLDFAVGPDDGLIVLASGVACDPRDGSRRSRFLGMRDCTSIAARPGGGFLGASSRGRIYCWD